MNSLREFRVTNHEGYSCRERAYTEKEAIRKAADTRLGYEEGRCTAEEVMSIPAEMHIRRGVERYKER